MNFVKKLTTDGACVCMLGFNPEAEQRLNQPNRNQLPNTHKHTIINRIVEACRAIFGEEGDVVIAIKKPAGKNNTYTFVKLRDGTVARQYIGSAHTVTHDGVQYNIRIESTNQDPAAVMREMAQRRRELEETAQREREAMRREQEETAQREREAMRRELARQEETAQREREAMRRELEETAQRVRETMRREQEAMRRELARQEETAQREREAMRRELAVLVEMFHFDDETNQWNKLGTNDSYSCRLDMVKRSEVNDILDEEDQTGVTLGIYRELVPSMVIDMGNSEIILPLFANSFYRSTGIDLSSFHLGLEWGKNDSQHVDSKIKFVTPSQVTQRFMSDIFFHHTHIVSLRDDSQNQTHEREAMRREVEAVVEQVDEMVGRANELESDLARHGEAIEEGKERANELESDLARHADEIEAVVGRADEMESELARHADEIVAGRERGDEMESELARHADEIEAVVERGDDMESELARHADEIEAVVEQGNEQQERTDLLESDVAELQHNVEEIAEKQKDYEEQLNKLNSMFINIENDLSVLANTVLPIANDNNARINAVEQMVKVLQDDGKKLAESNSAMKLDIMKQLIQLSNAIDQFNANNESTENDNSEFTRLTSRLQSLMSIVPSIDLNNLPSGREYIACQLKKHNVQFTGVNRPKIKELTMKIKKLAQTKLETPNLHNSTKQAMVVEIEDCDTVLAYCDRKGAAMDFMPDAMEQKLLEMMTGTHEKRANGDTGQTTQSFNNIKGFSIWDHLSHNGKHPRFDLDKITRNRTQMKLGPEQVNGERCNHHYWKGGNKNKGNMVASKKENRPTMTAYSRLIRIEYNIYELTKHRKLIIDINDMMDKPVSTWRRAYDLEYWAAGKYGIPTILEISHYHADPSCSNEKLNGPEDPPTNKNRFTHTYCDCDCDTGDWAGLERGFHRCLQRCRNKKCAKCRA